MKYVYAVLILIFLSGSAFGQELNVEDIKIGTAIVEKEVTGIATEFTADIGKLYCYTRILDAKEATNIYHVWYYGDKVMAEVKLPVTTPKYRTHSSKNIIPSWKGEWKVEVQSADKKVLTSTSFTVN